MNNNTNQYTNQYTNHNQEVNNEYYHIFILYCTIILACLMHIHHNNNFDILEEINELKNYNKLLEMKLYAKNK
jgi:hypothetical protein